jgi:hypothetical protein
MFRDLFTWLDEWRYFYWVASLLSEILLAGWVVARFRDRASLRPSDDSKFYAGILFFAVLFAGRWPFLLSATEYNPDESQIIAGAITLTRDPVFWRAVDGTTSGPLNFYALLPLHWLGAPLDFFSARFTGLLLVWVALFASYIALTINYSMRAARLAILPAVVFFALVHEGDFVHYSSEHVSLALFACAVAFISGARASGKWGSSCFLAGGFIAGLMPWAKLQSAPLGLTLVVWGACCYYYSEARNSSSMQKCVGLSVFLICAAIPSLLFLAVILITNQTDVFVQNYVVQNLLYVGGGNSVSDTIARLWHFAQETHLLPTLMLAQGIALVIGSVWLLKHRKGPDFFWSGGALFSAVALISVLTPGRPFLHYTLFLVLPLTLWSGAAIGRFLSESPGSSFGRLSTALLFSAGTLLPLGVRWSQPLPDMIGRFSYDWRHPRSSLGSVLRSCAQPGDTLAIWGWLARLHVESGLPQATREGYTYWSIMPSPLQSYHRSIFLADVVKNQPTFFVDAVGPQSYYFQNRTTEAHEIFPALEHYIAKNYVLVVDFGNSRLFVRRDRINRSSLELAALQRAVERGRAEEDFIDPKEEIPIAPGMSRKTIAGEQVVMMLPPSQVAWRLAGIEREFDFEYGYDPVAYQKATQGNGTEITVSLEVPGQNSRILFQRTLDPAHVDADHGVHLARVMIPGTMSGALVRIKTGPGAYNDNSWDWTFISNVRFRRHPYYALPTLAAKKDLWRLAAAGHW